MGIWSTDPFGNDAAADWAAGIGDSDLLDAVRKSFARTASTFDTSDAEAAVAAAAALAILTGVTDVSSECPEDLMERLERSPQRPDKELLSLGTLALDRVFHEDSELRQLWSESPEWGEWSASIARIRATLLSPPPDKGPRKKSPKRAPRIHLAHGDVFGVPLPDGAAGFVQYIGDDSEQLGSALIVAFASRGSIATPPTPDEIVAWPIAFYAHVFLRNAIRFDGWTKVGHAASVRECPVQFSTKIPTIRETSGGSQVVEVWRLWHPNREAVLLDDANEAIQSSEPGSVMPGSLIARRMATGQYH